MMKSHLPLVVLSVLAASVSRSSTAQSGPPASTDSAAPAPCPAGTMGRTGVFKVAGGQIIGPDGQPFIARGVNLYDFEMTSAAASLRSTFPGLNFVRVNIHSYADPSTYRPFVNRMTRQGIVVEFEDHPDGGGGDQSGKSVFAGSQLATEAAWYASMGAYYKNDPYVWFGTYNEPPTKGGSLSQWQSATYHAIRDAGNNSPILLEVSGSRPNNLNAALDPLAYASMTNTIWDVHVYGYQSNYSLDQGTVDAGVTAMVSAAQMINSADGTMPVLIGEYGPSTDGTHDDANGMQLVTSVVNGGKSGRFGSAAWAWNPGGTADHLLDSNGKPSNPYGRQVQRYIETGAPPSTRCRANHLGPQETAPSPTAPAATDKSGHSRRPHTDPNPP